MRRSVTALIVAAVCVVMIVGCPPKSTTDDGTTEIVPKLTSPTPSSGKLSLPSGASLAPETLKVITNAGEAAVNADGSFTAQVIANIPSLVPVVNANDHVVLLGFLSAGSNQTIDVKSTADALLYFSIGGFGAPQERLIELLNIIHGSKAEANLAAAIAAALAVDPEVLLNGNASIATALTAAQDLVFNGNPSARQVQARPASKTRTQVAAETANNFLTIDPLTPQSGFSLAGSDDGLGLLVRNRFPRRGLLYLFETGYTDLQGQETKLPNAQQIDTAVDIPEAKAFEAQTNVGQAIANTSVSPWQEGRTGPILLSQHDNAAKTSFEVVILGAALDQTGSPPAFTDSKYLLFRDEFMKQAEQLQYEAFIYDFMVPLAEMNSIGSRVTLLPLPIINPGDTRPTIALSARQLIEPLLKNAGVSLETSDGFQAAIKVITDQCAGNEDFRNKLVDALIVGYQDQTGELVSKVFMSANLRRLSNIRSVYDAVQSAFRKPGAARIIPDLQNSKKADVWTASISAVQLTPQQPTVKIDDPGAVLTATVAGSPPTPLTFHWSTTGTKGRLTTALGKDGTAFDAAENQVDYIAESASIVDGTLDSVSVSVKDANGKFVGAATTTVLGSTKSPSACTNFPEDDYNKTSILKLTISPNVVIPGKQITCKISYAFDAQHTGGVKLYCGDGCGFCDSYRASGGYSATCVCTSDILKRTLINGLPGVPGAGLDSATRLEGVGQNQHLTPVRVSCPIIVNVPFDVPSRQPGDPPFVGTLTSTVIYTVHEDNHGCQPDQPDCACPSIYASAAEPDDKWIGNFVVATAGSEIAVRAFNYAIDPGGSKPFCPP